MELSKENLEEEIKSQEVKRLENVLAMTNEKKLAQGVLAKLHVVDPTACIAGGAPRDWELETTCNDIDIFYESTIEYEAELQAQLEQALRFDFAGERSEDQQKMLGWQHEDDIEDLNILPVYVMSDINNLTLSSPLYANNNVKAVFECTIAMTIPNYDGDYGVNEDNKIIDKKVQFICVNSTYDLFDYFDCSINCIKMTMSQWSNKYDHYFNTEVSTLHRVGHLVKKIHFAEQLFKDKKVTSNKAYRRFVENGDYYLGNEREFMSKLYNMYRKASNPDMSTRQELDKRCFPDNPERRHESESFNDIPF